MKFFLFDVINRLNIASKKKQTTVKIPFSKFGYVCLYFLYKEGLINSFQLVEFYNKETDSILQHYCVFLKYRQNQPCLPRLNFISDYNKNHFVSVKDLFALKSNGLNGAVSTSKGLLNIDQALLLNKGGLLLFYF